MVEPRPGPNQPDIFFRDLVDFAEKPPEFGCTLCAIDLTPEVFPKLLYLFLDLERLRKQWLFIHGRGVQQFVSPDSGLLNRTKDHLGFLGNEALEVAPCCWPDACFSFAKQ